MLKTPVGHQLHTDANPQEWRALIRPVDNRLA
jgi:hypothetical protein